MGVGSAGDDPFHREVGDPGCHLGADRCQSLIGNGDNVAGNEGRCPQRPLPVDALQQQHRGRDRAGDAGGDARVHLSPQGDRLVGGDADGGSAGPQPSGPTGRRGRGSGDGDQGQHDEAAAGVAGVAGDEREEGKERACHRGISGRIGVLNLEARPPPRPAATLPDTIRRRPFPPQRAPEHGLGSGCRSPLPPVLFPP